MVVLIETEVAQYGRCLIHYFTSVPQKTKDTNSDFTVDRKTVCRLYH